jgi:creatinine amidohydrolase/Fe(II)-dependent formamide hydrolase-like protein
LVLEKLTSGAVAGDLLIVPLGPTEQHGPRLPLRTDMPFVCADGGNAGPPAAAVRAFVGRIPTVSVGTSPLEARR